MGRVVTNHMLRKKLAQVNRDVRIMSAGNNPQAVLEDVGTVLLSEQKIVKVKDNMMITENGTRAKLFSPMPCLYWKCVKEPDPDGTITLSKSLTGLFVEDGNETYCLGINGSSDDFEVRLQVGDDEIRLNHNFLNISTPHLVVNGLEAKINE